MTMDSDLVESAGIAERERVLRALRAKEGELRAMGITRLRLFGSMARGEAGPESDIDLIADISSDASFSLLDHVGLEQDLGDLLARTVDITTAPWKMRPRMRDRVEQDIVEVF